MNRRDLLKLCGMAAIAPAALLPKKTKGGHCGYCYDGSPMPPTEGDPESFACDAPMPSITTGRGAPHPEYPDTWYKNHVCSCIEHGGERIEYWRGQPFIRNTGEEANINLKIQFVSEMYYTDVDYIHCVLCDYAFQTHVFNHQKGRELTSVIGAMDSEELLDGWVIDDTPPVSVPSLVLCDTKFFVQTIALNAPEKITAHECDGGTHRFGR